jgi:hypothetical protein
MGKATAARREAIQRCRAITVGARPLRGPQALNEDQSARRDALSLRELADLSANSLLISITRRGEAVTRRVGDRTTCEASLFIDARLWRREGLLRAGECFPYSWTHAGETAGRIHVRIESNEAILRFHFYPQRGVSELVEQYVPFEWTACHFGGSRPWFRCTATVNGEKCRRRVARLYLGASPVFACRHCHDLVFASQLESVGFRGLGRARKVRMRLGSAPDLFGPFPERPKGMHRKTYERLRHVHDIALARV